MESFSQFGEDVLLWEHFGRRPGGFFVEVGANHPTRYSQTWFFEQRGWKGLLVEPLSQKAALLRAHRPGSRVFQNAVAAPEKRGRARFQLAAGDDMLSALGGLEGVASDSEEVEVRTLDDILAEAGDPKIDLLSIDVEGWELDVLKGFSIRRHQPKVVLLEDHLQSLDVHRHMTAQGYRLVKRTGCNNWYVPAESSFTLNSAGENFRLRKQIWLDTPVRILRFKWKRTLAKKA
jgi:FkbM family methyltransferase